MNDDLAAACRDEDAYNQARWMREQPAHLTEVECAGCGTLGSTATNPAYTDWFCRRCTESDRWIS